MNYIITRIGSKIIYLECVSLEEAQAELAIANKYGNHFVLHTLTDEELESFYPLQMKHY